MSASDLVASILAAPALAALLSLLAGCFLIRHAARLGLQDLPNARSSHVLPRPRGGGTAIVAGFLLALPLGMPPGMPSSPAVWLPLAAAVMLALVGLLDDLRGLGLAIRLAAQSLATAAVLLALAWGGAASAESDIGMLAAVTGLPPPSAWLPAEMVPAAIIALDLMMIPVLMLAGIWWINLFNFMDGIDGLAASEALFLLLAALAIKSSGPLMDDSLADFITAPGPNVSLILAGAVAGFLLLNWPPARIFMGDAGSLFLGFSIFAIAAHDVTYGDMSVWSWLILGSLFLADATVTLLRRWLTGQSVTSAHRSHLYQRLSRRWGRHSTVTLVYCLLNVTWLFPLALLAHRAPQWAPLILVIASLPPALIAWRAGAGLKET